jgi:Outer membrane protein/protective antigen OMA87
MLLKIIIEEGSKTKVRDITFEGNKDFDEGDLRGAMGELSVAKWWKFWSSGKFDPEKFKKDKESIIKFYRKNGYRDAEILSDSLIYSNDKKM